MMWHTGGCLKHLNWAMIDQNLSATWFSGQGRAPSCTHCLSEEHVSETCRYGATNPLQAMALDIYPQWVPPSCHIPSKCHTPPNRIMLLNQLMFTWQHHPTGKVPQEDVTHSEQPGQEPESLELASAVHHNFIYLASSRIQATQP